jgi:tRNA(Ile)-lysidine synthase
VCDLGAGAFERRLDPDLDQPIAVAFSGGGDSLGALIATKAWADACGRPVIALHVDHRLQPSSEAWSAFAADVARRLGVGFRLLTWTAHKPERGLAAAARSARHALIAAAARDSGASAVVFGHTADDRAEAVLMRAEGSSLGIPGEWRPSPVWPEGRGIFLLRPLLGVRRAAIRRALRRHDRRWIDDPANDDPRHARARARARLTEASAVPSPAPDDPAVPSLAGAAVLDDWGAIRMDREALRRAPTPAARRVLAAAMLSAGGGARPPRRERVEALAARVAGADDFAATLAGAKLIAGGDVLIVRESGEIDRTGAQPIPLDRRRALIWDGRFEIPAGGSRTRVFALKGAQARLEPSERQRLAAAPAAARPSLPVIADPGGRLACPILAGEPAAGARSLAGMRFLAACGAISREPRA